MKSTSEHIEQATEELLGAYRARVSEMIDELNGEVTWPSEELAETVYNALFSVYGEGVLMASESVGTMLKALDQTLKTRCEAKHFGPDAAEVAVVSLAGVRVLEQTLKVLAGVLKSAECKVVDCPSELTH